MLLKYFIVILLTIYVTQAAEEDSEFKSTGKYVLKKRQRDIEDTLHEKFKKLEKSVIDTLEEYLDGKINLLQKNIYRKIDSLEENIPSKTDIFGIERDLETLKNGSIPCGSNSLESGQAAEINTKLNKIQNDISKLEQTITSVTNLESILNQTKQELHRVVEEVIKPELDALNKKIPENFEESTNLKLDVVKKEIVEFNKNVSGEFDALENTLTHKLDEIKSEIPLLEQNLNNTLDALTNLSHVQQPTNNGYLDCKKREAQGYDFVPITMDSNTLKFSSVEYDSEGHISRFDIHLAIKGSNYNTHIQLSPTDHPTTNDRYFLFDFIRPDEIFIRSVSADSNENINSNWFRDTLLRTGGVPLSTEKYLPFYLRYNDGTLEFGPEGKPAVVRFTNSDLKLVKYIGFTAWSSVQAKFLYDCPAGFEESLRTANL